MLFSETIQKKLEYLDFRVIDSERSPVIFVSELYKSKNLSAAQILALEEAKTFNADAVFFRYFEDDNRSPIPQVYIYDNESGRFNSRYEQIHKELWSSCNIPAFIIVEDFKIKIFDCRKPVKIDSKGVLSSKEIASIDTREIAKYSEVISKYNAEKFCNGTFWESDEAHQHFTYGKTAYKDLIGNLKFLRQAYSGKRDSLISAQLADYIIIISILIKYLEENGIDENGENLASIFFYEQVKCKTFIEILQKNKFVAILDALAKKFNGGIFYLSNAQKKELRRADLTPIQQFFDARLDGANQLVIWPLYSFKHIPVELISNIYEEFIPEGDKGSVYTPHYLVNLLIDECIPLPNKSTYEQCDENIKLIDVSCGSGIFLVNAFKRLVQVYKIKQYYKNGTYPKIIAIKKLHSLIEKNIFGVDVNQHAVDLTKFSLSLAICQLLSPKQIWTELSFADLGKKNIQKRDFFEYISDTNNLAKYDLVLGNPPFNAPPSLANPNESILSSEYITDVISNYKLESQPIGDYDLALFFLQQSLKLLKEDTGLLCLIQKSIPLLHTKDNQDYRKELFNNFTVPQVIDFTPYRRTLFPNATVPICAIFVENRKPTNDSIAHIVIKRTRSGKERLFFEIDTYDINYVNRDEAHLNSPWKANLFGGYRLLELTKKLNKYPTIIDFIGDSFNKKGNWSVTDFEKHRNDGLFISTKITHGQFPQPIIGGIPNSNTWGIVGDVKKIETLKKYFSKNGNLLCANIAGTSTRQGIDRIYDLNTEDIRKLPMLTGSEIEKLSISDKILINDVAKYKITEFGDPESCETNKDIIVRGNKIPVKLIEFSETYVSALNSIYKKNNKEFTLTKVSYSNSSFVLEFEYCKPQQKDLSLNYIASNLDALTNCNLPSVLVKRISNIYSYDKIILIKPKQLRFWLRLTALIDADSTLNDIVNYKLHVKHDK